MEIRKAEAVDFPGIWAIFRAVVHKGDTYVFDPDCDEAYARSVWMSDQMATYVAVVDGRIAGTYILKANQPGLGDHVANAAFMVSPENRRGGVGRAMGEHALEEARRAGFRAMQFNFVVSTNTGAVKLWESLGFEIVGTLPEVFRHRELGFVDAYVLYRKL
ncbi:MAG: GNAT family N-acetyltransferase [bacterium]|nr:GNAT family N-acetyltransferase [bacterium]